MNYTLTFDVETFAFWGGAKNTIEIIRGQHKMGELQTHIEEIFCDTTPTATEINDYVWFAADEIYKQLEIEID